MKRQILFVTFVIAALLVAACGAQAAAPSEPAYYRTDESYGVGGGAPQAPAPDMAMEAGKALDVPNSAPEAQQQRVVIQTADLALVVGDPQAKMSEIAALANKLGGFVVSSNIYETYTPNGAQVPEGTITVRVPATELDNVLKEIKTGVIEVQSETRSGEDVTDQYVDLQSRLKARQVAEAQLLEMLENAQNAEDTLAIFNQLTLIQSEIEVLKGQINYFDQAARLSAVSVRLIAEESIQPIQIAGWRPQGVARDAVQALVDFFQGFINFLIWLVIFIIPVAALIIVLLALLWRLLRWFWRKVFPKKTPPPAAPAE